MYNTQLLVPNFLAEQELIKSASREGFGEEIVNIAQKNPNLVVLNADLMSSLKLNEFSQKFPQRYFQVGVSEEAMAGIGTGLALYGKIPVITSFAAFSPGLNWSQLRLAALSMANLKVCSSHYGLNAGEDGPTAQMLEDVALMRVIPNFIIVSPADNNQAKLALNAIIAHNGPAYLRLTRAKFPNFINPAAEFVLGKAQILREGKDLSVVVNGSISYEALMAVENLSSEIDIELINLHTIKPLDLETISKSLAKTKKLVTIEEHQIMGGMGSAILEALATLKENPLSKSLLIGVNDQFGTSGDGNMVLEKYGLTRNHLTERIRRFYAS